MHRSRAAILIGALAATAALWLPYVELEGLGAMNGFEADAWPAVALLTPAVLIAVIGDRRESPGTAATAAAVVVGLAALGFGIVKLIDAATAASDAGGSPGPGAWVVSGALLVAAAGTWAGIGTRIR
jgi:hypothetical protein